MDEKKLLRVMRQLALEAGNEILNIYNSDSVEIRTKADNSPVTLADEISDSLISKGLRENFPHIPVVTEEQFQSQNDYYEKFFIVDPLDGTKEFINKRDEFTVNIALIERGIPIKGVVFAPAMGQLFYTNIDGRAIEEHTPYSAAEFGKQYHITVSKPDNSSLRIVASESHRDKSTDDYISSYKFSHIKTAGSSLKFCLIARGEADLYPRLGRTMEWDTAAGDAILRAAGGKLADLESLKPLKYGKPNYANPFFIAYSDGVVISKNI